MLRLFHTKGHPKKVVKFFQRGEPLPLVWIRKKLPDEGAMQYAFETYGTPTYDRAKGDACTHVRRPLNETFPALWVNNQWPVLTASNIFQGQIATQPLLDPNSAVAIGAMTPDVVPPEAYNIIPATGPVLAP